MRNNISQQPHHTIIYIIMAETQALSLSSPAGLVLRRRKRSQPRFPLYVSPTECKRQCWSERASILLLSGSLYGDEHLLCSSGNAENANPARDSDPPRAGGLWVVQKNVVKNSVSRAPTNDTS